MAFTALDLNNMLTGLKSNPAVDKLLIESIVTSAAGGDSKAIDLLADIANTYSAGKYNFGDPADKQSLIDLIKYAGGKHKTPGLSGTGQKSADDIMKDADELHDKYMGKYTQYNRATVDPKVMALKAGAELMHAAGDMSRDKGDKLASILMARHRNGPSLGSKSFGGYTADNAVAGYHQHMHNNIGRLWDAVGNTLSSIAGDAVERQQATANAHMRPYNSALGVSGSALEAEQKGLNRGARTRGF